MKLNGIIACESVGQGRCRGAVAMLALAAGFTIASSDAAFAYDDPTPTCQNDYATYLAAPRTPEPTSRIEIVGARLRKTGDALRTAEDRTTTVGETGIKPPQDNDPNTPATTPEEVGARIFGTPAVGRSLVNVCRFFDDAARPSEEHYDFGNSATPGNASAFRTLNGARYSYVGHYYSQPGYYTLWGHVIDDQGAWSLRASERIYVTDAPNVDFDISPIKQKVGEPVSFTSKTTDTDQPSHKPLTLEWDLDGDGSFTDAGGSARGETATHVYASEAPVTVSLRARDEWGVSKVGTRQVQFNNLAPRASFSFSPSSPQAEQAVTFSSSSVDPDGTVAASRWDLDGDGAFDDATGPTVSFAFPRAGTFPVSLKVTDDSGKDDIVVRTVTVSAPVVAASPVAAAGAAGATRATATRRGLLSLRVRLSGLVTGRGTRLRILGVTTARGATVRVRCVGRDCKPRAQTLRSQGRLLRLKRFQRSYRAGTVLHVYVTQSGSIGRYVRIKIRRGKAPLRSDLCLKPGSTRPTRCR